MKKTIFMTRTIATKKIILGILVSGVLLAGCERTDPALNSVITVHGNTDWHIDTAEEFLFGTDMNGNTTAANHVPDDWLRNHLHVGLTNTDVYYYDSSKIATGKDTTPLVGIDQAMLFFYAGHGNPDLWNTLGNSASQSNMLLANNAQNNWGVLRYYWQCSCDVFAHGPQTCASGTGTDFEYSCPGQFNGSSDSVSHRNVYERWGPALSQNLRMACGSSTLAYCHESEANRIWDNYNNKSYDVSDSFIYGLHGNANVVPLCVTRGNSDVTKTPLFDHTFTNQKNPVGSGLYMHIQYLSNFAKRGPQLEFRVPKAIEILSLKAMKLPDTLANTRFIDKDGIKISEEQIDTRGAKIRVNPRSGAVSMLGPKADKLTAALSEDEYVERAKRYLEEQGWTEPDMQEPEGSAMKLQAQGVQRDVAEIPEQQKSVSLEFKRAIVSRENNESIPVLGEGGKIDLQMNNDGTVFAAAKVWRALGDVVKMAAVKPYDQALDEATRQMGGSQNYRLKDWKFGYVETSGNVAQEQLTPAYQFSFEPLEERLALESPPRMVQVAGVLDQ